MSRPYRPSTQWAIAFIPDGPETAGGQHGQGRIVDDRFRQHLSIALSFLDPVFSVSVKGCDFRAAIGRSNGNDGQAQFQAKRFAGITCRAPAKSDDGIRLMLLCSIPGGHNRLDRNVHDCFCVNGWSKSGKDTGRGFDVVTPPRRCDKQRAFYGKPFEFVSQSRKRAHAENHPHCRLVVDELL